MNPVAVAVMFLLLCVAVVSDLATRRIPNALVVAGTVIGIALNSHLLAMGLSPLAGAAWYLPLAGALTGVAIALPMYALRVCGAGDAKLMGMVGAFVGPASVLMCGLFTLVAGGALSLVVMLRPRIARETLSNLHFLLLNWSAKARGGSSLTLPPLQSTAFRLPYAVAITVGTAAWAVWHGPLA